MAAAWLMMAFEGLFLSAVIARCAAPKVNLAAFGISFYLAVLMEAPIIMLMSASTALCKDGDSFFKLRRFTYLMNGIVSLIMVIILFPPLFSWVSGELIQIPANVAHLTHNALLMMLPWPAAIGYRRFYQGILIRFNKTRRVAYGTAIRLVSMAVTARVLYFLKISGAYIGAIALTTGVIFEAAASRLMVQTTLVKLKKIPIAENGNPPLSFPSIFKFYYPLMLMSTLSLGIHPIATFFMGRGRFPIESLAVFPVVNSFIFVFRSLALSFQEVVIALLGDNNEGYSKLRNFALFLGIFTFVGLAILTFTPLLKIWFLNISGLSLQLTTFSYLPTRILILLPPLSVLVALQRSILVKMEKTTPITWATIIEIVVIILILQFTIVQLNFIGIVAAALAFNAGRLCANLFLLPHQLKAVRIKA